MVLKYIYMVKIAHAYIVLVTFPLQYLSPYVDPHPILQTGATRF